jgi:outer membrane lipoprotein SlyB
MLRLHAFSSFVVAIFAAAPAMTTFLSAQPAQTQTVRVRGTIERVDGNDLLVKSRDGADLRISLGEGSEIIGLKKIGLSEVAPNAFVGVAALPQSDGAQTAISIHVFQESSRGVNEGSRPYDVGPNSTMTNGAVADRVKGIDGDELTIKYKDGEKIIVTPETSIARIAEGLP